MRPLLTCPPHPSSFLSSQHRCLETSPGSGLGWSVTQGSPGEKRHTKAFFPGWEEEWIENHSPDSSGEVDFSPYKVWEVNR